MALPDGGATLALSDDERDMLTGSRGPALGTAMQIIVAMARVFGAERLIPITGAHIDGCLYHGQAGLDFAERLAADGGRVGVPTTLNVSALDLLHPDLVRLDADTRSKARRQMDAYLAMGCQPTWTCAPYQLPTRPAYGEHVAWAESNAIVFANSVLGARTDRYGDFLDICAALAARVPYAGLHRPEERRARIVFDLPRGVAGAGGDELYGLVGHLVGRACGSLVPAITGLPFDATEDQLKALGAAAASSGSVGLVHVVGVTPEAPTLQAALGDREPERVVELSAARLAEAWDELSTADGRAPLAAVSVGTPHFSMAEIERLVDLLAGRRVDGGVETYVSTGRHVAELARTAGLLDTVEAAGIRVVVDTCTYVTPILGVAPGATVMTSSAKWAWYAPGNLGVAVVYGSLADCVESAVAGRVVRERPRYLDG